MNEADTRAQHVDPKLAASGWGIIEDSKILREHRITEGRIQIGGPPEKGEIADYVLVYKNQKLAVIEAKKEALAAGEGVTQAKSYAQKLQTGYTYSTNGREIYEICLKTGKEGLVDRFPTPVELWNLIYSDWNEWKERFTQIPFEKVGDSKSARYYQENAVNNVMKAVAEEKNRILLTLATGTGKTFIAFQIAWKLFQSRWNLKRDAKRRPRILFLADRNILANQAFNSFSSFQEDALARISPKEIRKKGSVTTNANIFFTIFQTFMSGPGDTPYYGHYPKDFFDFIIIDECHRGGANDESSWRNIMEHFSPAVQLGLTATPKRKDNVDTYSYFGDPVYTYSLKQGINDGFLTPFKVKRIQTTLDDYLYSSDDEIIEGEIEERRLYTESDFNRIIEIKAREEKRVKVLMDEINQNQKTIVFCASQEHAAAIRDLINQNKQTSDVQYCVRVTANDGETGEQYLRAFQDNDKTIPTILTTSQKLSTGVDARNVRNIVLMRPVNSMIEFKQIVGRGTRLFEGKKYFTIIDFVGAYKLFSDPEWDGEPLEVISEGEKSKILEEDGPHTLRVMQEAMAYNEPRQKLKIKLSDGKEREIQHMVSTIFYTADGKALSMQEFLEKLYADFGTLFKTEEELRKIWSNPTERSALLEKIQAIDCGSDNLESVQKSINAEESDIFDVLAYISFAIKPITRTERTEQAKDSILEGKSTEQQAFLEFVLDKYIERGIEELGEDQLPDLLKIKYHGINDAEKYLGTLTCIRNTFFEFQKKLFDK